MSGDPDSSSSAVRTWAKGAAVPSSADALGASVRRMGTAARVGFGSCCAVLSSAASAARAPATRSYVAGDKVGMSGAEGEGTNARCSHGPRAGSPPLITKGSRARRCGTC